MIGFEHFWALVLLAPWTMLVLAVFSRQKEAVEWLRERVAAKALARLTVYSRIRPRWHFLWLWFMGALIVGAASGPYSEGLGPVKREAHDIVLIIDASLSMLAPDAHPNPLTAAKYDHRLAAAKAFAADLVDVMPDARFALVSFSGAAALHSPITVDRYAVKTQILGVRSHPASQSTGSEFGQAFGAVIHLWRHREQPLQVVLLSDGDDSSDPEPYSAQLQALENLHIPVHTVAFGEDEFTGMNIFDPEDVVAGVEKPRIIADFQTKRNDYTLSDIAEATGGTAMIAEDDWVPRLASVLKSMPAQTVSLRHPSRRDWSWVLVSLFGLLFLAESRVFRKKLPVVAAVLLAVPWTGCSSDEVRAHHLNEDGRDRFREEKWDEAGAAFEQSAAFQVRPWVPTHNLAMVHERRGMYAEAHKVMEQAIVMEPDYVEAFFGDGAVLYAWGHAEFHLENCRAERTRELWTRARERFQEAEERGGFWSSVGDRAATNIDFLDQRLQALDAVEEACRNKQDNPPPDGGTADGGTSDGGASDAGSPDAGSPDAGSPDAGSPDAGSPDGGSDGGADGGGADAGADGGADAGGSDGGLGEGEQERRDTGGEEDPGGGQTGGPDGGTSGSGSGEEPSGELTEEELRRIAEEIDRVRKEGQETADSWRQVRQSQFRLEKRDAGAGGGKPAIRW
jgi:tetratricopeptide (TPR) repeat protein